MPSIIDHVDLRVRDRAAATAFYDAFLSILGAVKREGDEFTTWRIPPPGAPIEDSPDNFGIVEDRQLVPGAVRIAFKAPSRDCVDAIATILLSLGMSNIEMDDGMYGEDSTPSSSRMLMAIAWRFASTASAPGAVRGAKRAPGNVRA